MLFIVLYAWNECNTWELLKCPVFKCTCSTLAPAWCHGVSAGNAHSNNSPGYCLSFSQSSRTCPSSQWGFAQPTDLTPPVLPSSLLCFSHGIELGMYYWNFLLEFSSSMRAGTFGVSIFPIPIFWRVEQYQAQVRSSLFKVNLKLSIEAIIRWAKVNLFGGAY